MFAGTGVALKLAKVTAVDVDRKTVTVTAAHDHEREELEYDTLVYALGSGWHDGGVPGVAEHAHEIAGRPGAPPPPRPAGRPGRGPARGRRRRRPDRPGGRDRDRRDPPGPERLPWPPAAPLGDWLSAKGRTHLRKVLDRLGITVHEHAAVSEVRADGVTTADGRTVPADVTVWTTGFAVHPIARATTLEVTDRGRIVVDSTMRSVSHPDVYAVGDAATALGPNGKPLRMSCASGVPMAWQAADAIAARLAGTKVPHVPIRYFQQCVSLGRKEGLIQFVTADDRAVDRALTGRTAALYKELICKGRGLGRRPPDRGPALPATPACRTAGDPRRGTGGTDGGLTPPTPDRPTGTL